jgi:ABC-type transport system substrate-binding protein
MKNQLTAFDKHKQWLRWFAVLAIVSSSCRDTKIEQQDKVVLRIGVGVGASAKGSGLSVLRELLYAEPLIGLDARGQPVPRLAERWEWLDNFRTLKLELRIGTKLHDGRTLNAALARAFLQKKIDEVQQSDHAGSFEGIQSIELPDDHTMLIHLRQPDAFLLSEFNNAYLVDPSSPNIGTGPYRLLSREPVRAEKFDDHHRGAPAIQKVEIQTFESQRAAWAALMRGEVDAVQEVNRDSVEFMEGATNVTMFASLRPYYWALSFNLRHPQLRRQDLRRAMANAVNREEIVARVLHGHGTVAADPVWPLFFAYQEISERPHYDPAGARVAIEQARVRGFDVRQVSFKCLFYAEDPQVERMALLLQRQLTEVGVDLQLEAATLNEMTAKLQSGAFESMLLPFASGRALDWTYRFWHSPVAGQQPIQSIDYAGADNALDELRVAFTEDQIRIGVAKLRRDFYQDPPAIFIAWQQVTRAVSTQFDISDADKQDAFANIWQWKPAAKRQ